MLGFVFFIAGILKLMDPVGTGLVVGEYFKFFHLAFLLPVAKITGVAVAFVETVLGAALLTGIWSRVVRWITLGVLLFFTVVTFILLLAGPAFDCGCFGQAVHLSHKAGFIKNLILLAVWASAYVPLSNNFEAGKIKYAGFGIAVISTMLFALYSLMSLPLIDFTPLKAGEEVVGDDGVSALSIADANGEYRDSLVVRGNVLAFSVYDPEAIGNWSRLSSVMADAAEIGFEPLLLVSGTAEEMESLVPDAPLLSCLFFADHRTLMTFNRSNGGCVYLSDGTIIKKWSSLSYPKQDDLAFLAGKDPVEAVISANSSDKLRMQGFLLYVFAVMLLL